MKICQVIGHLWATKKADSLIGEKLMVVEELPPNRPKRFVAADLVGAGIGEQVIVVSGSTARQTIKKDNPAVDAVIVGIIDSVEIPDEK